MKFTRHICKWFRWYVSRSRAQTRLAESRLLQVGLQTAIVTIIKITWYFPCATLISGYSTQITNIHRWRRVNLIHHAQQEVPVSARNLLGNSGQHLMRHENLP